MTAFRESRAGGSGAPTVGSTGRGSRPGALSPQVPLVRPECSGAAGSCRPRDPPTAGQLPARPEEALARWAVVRHNWGGSGCDGNETHEMPLWGRFLGLRLDSGRTQLVVRFRRLDDLVFAMYEHVTSPRGLQRDGAPDFFRASCARCHVPLDAGSIRRSGSALGVARGMASGGRRRAPGCPGAGRGAQVCGRVPWTAWDALEYFWWV